MNTPAWYSWRKACGLAATAADIDAAPPGVQIEIAEHDVCYPFRAKLRERCIGRGVEEPHRGHAGVPGEYPRVDENGSNRSAVACRATPEMTIATPRAAQNSPTGASGIK